MGSFRQQRSGALPVIVIVILFVMSSAWSRDFYVSPDGSSSGDGSLERPWDLQTALNQPGGVQGGDTIWLRGGIYRRNNHVTKFASTLSGTPDAPITVRRCPAERAIIDGSIIQLTGGWVNYWGFEIMDSFPSRLTDESGPFPHAFWDIHDGQTNDLCVSGFDLRAPHVKLINLVIHDSIGGGIGLSASASDPEICGVLCYYNGWQGCDRSHGHGLYAQSIDPSVARVEESLFFSNYALGIQATGNESVADNFYFEGNALFFNGVLARRHQANFFLGNYTGTALRPKLIRNFMYDTQGSASDVNLGYVGGATDAVLSNNYFQTSVQFSPSNQNLVLVSNLFLSNTLFLTQSNYPQNFYLTNSPQTNFVEVRSNRYEPARANIIVYNWEGLDRIAVDVSNILSTGTEFEVRNAQDFFGPPVMSGTCTGSVLELPLTNLFVARPVGTNPPPATVPEFNVFILLPRESSITGGSNTGPAISAIADQVTDENTPTAPIPFVVQDAETPADYLNLSVHSSRPDLVPNKNIILGGSGENRSVIIVPAENKTGDASISIGVGDGSLGAVGVFRLSVRETATPSKKADRSSAQQENGFGFVGLTLQTNRMVRLSVYGTPDADYEVQASTNFLQWISIGTFTLDCNGRDQFEDSHASEFSMRYYRFRTNSLPWIPPGGR